MRNLPTTILAVLLAAGPATGADESAGTGAGAYPLAQIPTGQEAREVWSGTDRAVEMLTTRRAVIDSIRSKTAMPERPFAHLDETEEIRIISLSTVETTEEGHDLTLTEALVTNLGTIRDIRDQIRLNIHAVRALEAEGYTADDVLTWEFGGTAGLAIVVDDRDAEDGRTEP